MSAGDAAEHLRAIHAHTPAVDIIALKCQSEPRATLYPFTNAFCESEAYQHYRKQHVTDYVLPHTMSDMSRRPNDKTQLCTVLWDAQFIAERR